MSMMRQQSVSVKPIKMEYRNVCFTVRFTKKDPQTQKKLSLEKQILKNQSGELLPGEVTAVMGSSGSGKTSLLNILSDRYRSNSQRTIEGSIYINGHLRTDDFVDDFAYVTQDEIFLETLTPREMLRYSAEMQLAEVMTPAQRHDRVEEVLQLLNIAHCADTVVGTPGVVKGLSGGERKRVNIALSFLKSPSVIFLDEPTSGLDSTTSLKLLKTLRKLARGGRTIVTTIHQPSSTIFSMFDKLVLLADGESVYAGSAAKAVSYFSNVGFVCPTFENPADFVIDLLQHTGPYPPRIDSDDEVHGETPTNVKIHVDNVKIHIDSKDIAAANEVEMEPVPRITLKDGESSSTVLFNGSDIHDLNRAERVQYLQKVFKTTPEFESQNKPVELVAQPLVPKPGRRTRTKMALTKWWTSFATLSARSLKTTFRNKVFLRARTGQSIGLAIIAGLLYLQIGDNQSSIRDRQGALLFVILNLCFSSVNGVLFVFPRERPVFVREALDGNYGALAFFLSKLVTDAIIQTVFPIVTCVIVYWMVGFQAHADKFFIFLAAGVLSAHCGSSVGFTLGCGIEDFDIALAAAPGVLVPMFLFAGFFVKLDNIPVFIRWLQWLSPMKYGLEAVFINEISDSTYTCSTGEFINTASGPVCPFTTGEQVIDVYGYAGVPLYRSFVLLLVLTVVFKVFAFILLQRALNRAKLN
eukprot:GILJ01007000.1.p1 GENE.GILJ01007000.1~~GILJ01007000.1.p1  ORF type:complete len:695 (+),score=93.73 GILJ01007000.1:76-2160(+)